MTEPVAISVVIPWKDRPELRTCLDANGHYFPPRRCEIIVVNSGGDSMYLGHLLSGLPANIRAIYAHRDTFNKCFAQNVGAAVASGETLLLLDADVMLEVDLPALIAEIMGESDFLTVASVRESEVPAPCKGESGIEIAHQLEITLPQGKSIRLETNRTRPCAGVRSGPGLLAVRRRHFIAIGGANSRLRGWGWEDLDLIARLQFELGLNRVQAGSVVHLSHPDSARMFQGRSRSESEQENFLACLANYTAGLFDGTMVEDVQTLRKEAGHP